VSYIDFTRELMGLFVELLPCYIGTAHERAGTKIIAKSDGTPVIDLDNYTLSRLRELIVKQFPGDFIVGEEDRKNDEEIRRILERQNEYQWTIDGLDGTWHFIRGTNSYGAMVARRLGNEILYSAIFRPVDMALRGNGFFYAERGQGAWEWCSKCAIYHKLRAAQHGELERITVMLEGGSRDFFKYPPISKLGEKIITRPSLSSCIAATTVARGDATAVITRNHKPWDAWPIISFVEESEGESIVTDHAGNPYSLENCSNIVAAGNKEDHALIIEILNG